MRYVYRAVDQFGQVIDVFVSPRRDAPAAKRFFAKAIKADGRRLAHAGSAATRVDLAGLDSAATLANATAGRDLDDAGDVAAVLHGGTALAAASRRGGGGMASAGGVVSQALRS